MAKKNGDGNGNGFLVDTLVDTKAQEVDDAAVDTILDGLTGILKVGECYFFRTVTFHMLGRIRRIVGSWVVLDDTAWVAESSRFGEMILKGIPPSEYELTGDGVLVNNNSCSDIFPWKHKLPLAKKADK
jgi:hypothetical protein